MAVAVTLAPSVNVNLIETGEFVYAGVCAVVKVNASGSGTIVMVFVERFVAGNVGIRISAAAIFTVSNDSAVNRSGPLFVLPPITMLKVASESSLIDPLFVLSVI